VPEIDYEKLAVHLARFMCPDALLDADGVGALIEASRRQVLEYWAKADGFPKAIRPRGPDGKAGHPRWVRSDISDWVASHREKKAGRPRKNH